MSEMDIETKTRLLAVKQAAIVLKALADSFDDEKIKQETLTLVWAVKWAIEQIEAK